MENRDVRAAFGTVKFLAPRKIASGRSYRRGLANTQTIAHIIAIIAPKAMKATKRAIQSPGCVISSVAMAFFSH
jgi:hypothetical protein